MNSEQESTYVYLCTEPEYMYDTLYMYIYVQNLSVWTLDKTLHIYIYVKKLSVCTRLYICIIKCLYKTLYMFIYVQNLSVCTRLYIYVYLCTEPECMYKGEVYSERDTILDNCNTCKCQVKSLPPPSHKIPGCASALWILTLENSWDMTIPRLNFKFSIWYLVF